MEQTFIMTKEQAKEVNKFINKKSAEFGIKFAKVSFELLALDENFGEYGVYYIKKKMISKEYYDVSIIFEELKFADIISIRTMEHIYNEILK
jgi:hypothetical protein